MAPTTEQCRRTGVALGVPGLQEVLGRRGDAIEWPPTPHKTRGRTYRCDPSSPCSHVHLMPPPPLARNTNTVWRLIGTLQEMKKEILHRHQNIREARKLIPQFMRMNNRRCALWSKMLELDKPSITRVACTHIMCFAHPKAPRWVTSFSCKHFSLNR